MKKLAIAVPTLLVLVALGIFFALSTTPVVRIDSPPSVIGVQTPIQVTVQNGHGVQRLTAWIEQSGARHQVYEVTEPPRRSLFRKSESARQFTFKAGTKQANAVKDGKASLIVEAQSNDLRGAVTSSSIPVEINTKPPVLSVDGAQHYINQGGSELAGFTASGYWTEAGVRVGKYTFPSFAIPGKPANDGARFSLFAFPWDVAADTVPVVYARNPSGAEVTARFWFKVFPKRFRSRELPITDQFLSKVVNQIDPGGSGDLLTRFLKINGEMRHKNNETLAALKSKTEEKVLWSGPFYRIGQVESFFADKRSYMYNGKKVDEQVHLGFDLSDVQKAPVLASNSGKVAFAEDLGIYGRCVVVDHGYGLQTLYAHLSEIIVKVGDAVQKRQQLGRSGDTGLAGGDHLHFSMQINGVQVNPLEWWDEHWIKDRILSKLSPK